MTFLRPDFAAWALALPIVFACWAVNRQLRASFARRLGIASRVAGRTRRRGARDAAVLAAGLLTAASLSLALMRPQAPVTRRFPEYQRQDLIIMLDRSASMQARDIKPSRFSRATQELRNFVRHKPDGIDRIALVGFADEAVVLSYLTGDTDSVLFYFDWIDADPAPLFGTNIGAALNNAMAVAAKDDRPTGKLFLVVSDGEDFGSELDHALAAARARGYAVHCIGIGGDEAVPIVIKEAGGRDVPLRDDTGRTVMTHFSEGTLRRIAAATGGQYVRSTTGDELQRAIAGLVAGERHIVGWRTSTERHDIYPLFLALAAAAGMALWVLA
jgi:Ca-activated chloride channel family protein